MVRFIDGIDRAIAGWMQRWGTLLLRLSLGVIFIWFGVLKFVPNSEIHALVSRTIYWIDPKIALPILGVWEIAIGICLLCRFIRIALFLLVLQMPGTILPLIVLPDVCFTKLPWVPTVEGQYVIKNIILISAAIVVGGTARQTATPARKV